jgi:5-methylcytosine-specific restriction endonuclease McrA
VIYAFRHLVNLAISVSRERRKRKHRHPKWDETAREHLKKHPDCAACGGGKHLQVHHIEPVSNAPARELDPFNLVTMCMSKNECHLKIAHGGNWKRYNPKVIEHAKEARERPLFRREIEIKAREARLD